MIHFLRSETVYNKTISFVFVLFSRCLDIFTWKELFMQCLSVIEVELKQMDDVCMTELNLPFTDRCVFKKKKKR